jgi:rSAM/selenodomain-associated transferase 1
VGDQRYIVFSPTDKQDEFKNFCGEVLSKDTWQLTPQVDSDLGTRMRTFFDQQFARPAVEKVIVIGADSPQLTLGMIGKAFAELDHHDVVIGPSTDGGYYLLGMRTQSADLFSGIQWSDPSVYLDTVARLDRLNLSRFELPPLTDVDEYHDLEALHASKRWTKSYCRASKLTSRQGLIHEDRDHRRRRHRIVFGLGTCGPWVRSYLD